MIDIHSHLLWGLDDGPRTREQSQALIEAAWADGTTEMVAAPHASPEYPYDAALVRERFAELSAVNGTPLKLHLGCDFHLSHTNIEDALRNPSKYTIDGGPYLLVEFSDLVIFKTSDRDLERLQEAGMRPVVTHPERNPQLRYRREQLKRWVAGGCYLQITAGSYLGRFGKQARESADELTREGLVHFIASDAHHIKHRPPGLGDVHAYIADRYDSATADRLLMENPAAVLRADLPEAVKPPRPSRLGRIRRWLRF